MSLFKNRFKLTEQRKNASQKKWKLYLLIKEKRFILYLWS